jgi:hypothetical protein
MNFFLSSLIMSSETRPNHLSEDGITSRIMMLCTGRLSFLCRYVGTRLSPVSLSNDISNVSSRLCVLISELIAAAHRMLSLIDYVGFHLNPFIRKRTRGLAAVVNLMGGDVNTLISFSALTTHG